MHFHQIKFPEEDKVVDILQKMVENLNLEDKEETKNLTYDKLIENFKQGKYKKILVLTGAGISVSAGIPDYWSPKIGLYTTLKERFDLEYPE